MHTSSGNGATANRVHVVLCVCVLAGAQIPPSLLPQFHGPPWHTPFRRKAIELEGGLRPWSPPPLVLLGPNPTLRA